MKTANCETIMMSVNQWILVCDNKRQRNTERRAESAKRKHLAKFQKPHAKVVAARLPNGGLIKVDGHTRSYLWATNEIYKPDLLSVDVYDVANEDEAADLYLTFDSSAAVETVKDKVYGAQRELGLLNLKAHTTNGIKTALNLAQNSQSGGGAANIHELMEKWTKEIIALNETSTSSPIWQASTKAAFMVCFRRDGERCMEFWRLVCDDAGTKDGKTWDAVFALCEEIRKAKNERRNGSSSDVNLLLFSLSAYHAWSVGDHRFTPYKKIKLLTKAEFLAL